MLKSNIAACHIKLEEWSEAAESASNALSRLDKLMPPKKAPDATDERTEKVQTAEAPGDARVVELEDDDDAAEQALQILQQDDETKARIRAEDLGWRAPAKFRFEPGDKLRSVARLCVRSSRAPECGDLPAL